MNIVEASQGVKESVTQATAARGARESGVWGPRHDNLVSEQTTSGNKVRNPRFIGQTEKKKTQPDFKLGRLDTRVSKVVAVWIKGRQYNDQSAHRSGTRQRTVCK